jgi:hypothetical protein
VKLCTAVAVVLVGGLLVTSPLLLPRRMFWIGFIVPGIALAGLGAAALFCVRRYTIRQRELWIQRSFWQTRLPLRDLERAYVDPQAMKRTTRSAGNGGFMAYTGWFWNKKLGAFRAFVTDPARCVVLQFTQRRVVVSPDDPAAFVRALGFEAEAPKEAG